MQEKIFLSKDVALTLQIKEQDGIRLYFYPSIGWVPKERLLQHDIIDREKYIKFMYDPQNSHNCDICPENQDFNGINPCGQQNCWVDCHCNSR
mgnify:FL=1